MAWVVFPLSLYNTIKSISSSEVERIGRRYLNGSLRLGEVPVYIIDRVFFNDCSRDLGSYCCTKFQAISNSIKIIEDARLQNYISAK